MHHVQIGKILLLAKGCLGVMVYLIFQMVFKICQKCEADYLTEKIQTAQEGFM